MTLLLAINPSAAPHLAIGRSSGTRRNDIDHTVFPWVMIIAVSLAFTLVAQAQDKGEAARPEVGKPLQSAQELLQAQKPQEALAKIQEAENVGNKTGYETYIINRMRLSAAIAAGNPELAAKSFEAAMASGRMKLAEQLAIEQALTGTYYKAKDYSKAATWAQRYFNDGGKDPQMRTLLAQSYYLGGDFAQAAKTLQADIQADESAGRSPSEEQLQLLGSAYLKQNDRAGYAMTLEKLLAYYPKKEYWVDAIRHVQTRQRFADRLSLDVYRLKFAVGAMTSAADYMEATQLALQEGFPVEAKKIIDRGFASGVLGTGENAERHIRLRDLAAKSAAEDQKTLNQEIATPTSAKDGNIMVNTGFAYVGNGQYDQAINLMEEGIKKGNLKRPEDAKLHLGIAYLEAGQKAKAMQMFKTVQGSDGAAALARLWTVHAQHSAK